MDLNVVIRKKQQGLGLVSAIFVIVILAMITVGMNVIFTNSQKFRSQEVLASRALMAAKSGAELRLSGILHPENSETCDSSASPVRLDFNAAGINSCYALISCDSVLINLQRYYTVKSVGHCGSGLDSAIRKVKIRAAP